MSDNSTDLKFVSLRSARIVLLVTTGLAGSIPLCAADANSPLEQARESRRAGNLDAAADQLQRALDSLAAEESEPFRCALHIELGEVRLEQQRFQEAANHFEDALRAEPGQAVVHYQAGLAFLHIGNHSEAAAHLDQAVELGFRNAGVLFHLTRAQFGCGNDAAGLQHARELLSMKLTAPGFLFRLGRLLFRYFFYRDALQAFEAAIALEPPSYELRFFTALTNHLLNRHEETVRLLAFLDEKQATAESSALLASALAQQDRFVEAEALFRITMERYPASPHAYLNLAFVLLERGQTAEAEARLDDLRSIGATNSPKVFYTIRRNSCGEVNEQLGMEDALPARNSERAQAYFKLAQSLGDRHHDGTAIELLRLAHRYEGSTVRTLYAIAYGCLNLDPESSASVGILEKLLLLHPDSHQARYLLGRALMRQRRLDDAVATLRKAVDLDPENSGYLTELGRALIARGDSNGAEAVKVLTEAAKTDSGNAMARYELGKLLIRQERLPEALQVLEATIQIAPEFREAFYVLGQLCVRIGQRHAAKKYLDLFHEKLVVAKARSTVGEGFSRDN